MTELRSITSCQPVLIPAEKPAADLSSPEQLAVPVTDPPIGVPAGANSDGPGAGPPTSAKTALSSRQVGVIALLTAGPVTGVSVYSTKPSIAHP